MQNISRIASGAPWEPIFGYSRAVRAGDWIAVSGTTSFDERGLIVGPGQMYVQARQSINNIAAALERIGADLSHVVRTRVFVTDISRFDEVARAHRERFGDNPPAATAVEVRRLVHPDMLIEIEADAYFAPTPIDTSQSAKTRVTKSPTKTAKAKLSTKSKSSTKAKPVPRKSSPKRR